MDLKLKFNSETLETSIIIENGDTAICHNLETAIFVSLFTWRRAEEGDILPHSNSSKMGWWGDLVNPSYPADAIGSKLWLISREKITSKILKKAKIYTQEALAWMLEDNIAKSIKVEALRVALNTLALSIDIETVKNQEQLKFNYSITMESNG